MMGTHPGITQVRECLVIRFAVDLQAIRGNVGQSRRWRHINTHMLLRLIKSTFKLAQNISEYK